MIRLDDHHAADAAVRVLAMFDLEVLRTVGAVGDAGGLGPESLENLVGVSGLELLVGLCGPRGAGVHTLYT